MTKGATDTGTGFPPAAQASRSWRFGRAVGALILREIAATYGRSPGGYIWALVEPVGGIVILTLIFSFMLRAPALGVNFPLFYASGFLPFILFTQLSTRIGGAISYSRPLLAYPAVTFVDALFARFILAFFTNLVITGVVLAGIMTWYETQVVVNVPEVVDALLLAALLGFGLGVLNCYFGTAFPLWERAWNILSRPLLLLSGVLYIFEDLPRMARDILWWNPLIHVTGLMRRGIYQTYEADYASALYVLGVSMTMAALGLLFLRRYFRDLLEG